MDLEPINAYLARPLEARLQNAVDLILFNPPYVPTSSEEVVEAQATYDIQGSWAGGFNGMQVTSVFLDCVEVSDIR